MEVGNMIDLKNKNLKRIIDYMRFRPHSVKKRISIDLDLSFATVSNMTNYLTQARLIRQEDDESRPSVGRSPKQFLFSPTSYSILVIDLHRSGQMTFYIVDLLRNILCSKVYAVAAVDTKSFMEMLARCFADFMELTRLERQQVIGVGAVIPGTYDIRSRSVVGTSNQIFDGQPLQDMLEEITGLPVVPENDTNLAAHFSCRSCEVGDLVYVYLTDSIGIGVITGGKMLRSVFGYSSEIAHAPLGRPGRPCPYCGNRDCLQNDLSRAGYLSKYSGADCDIRQVPQDQWEAFLRDVKENHPRALEVVVENAEILGRSLAAVACLTRPSTVVIGGLPSELMTTTISVCEKSVNFRRYLGPEVKFMYDDSVEKTIAKGAAEAVYDAWYPDTESMTGRIFLS